MVERSARVTLSRLEVEKRLVEALEAAGLTVYRSFSLGEALASLPGGCECHGRADCTCSYAVLLAYDGSAAPSLVLAHGRDGLLQLRVSGGVSDGARERILEIATAAVAGSEALAPDGSEEGSVSLGGRC